MNDLIEDRYLEYEINIWLKDDIEETCINLDDCYDLEYLKNINLTIESDIKKISKKINEKNQAIELTTNGLQQSMIDENNKYHNIIRSAKEKQSYVVDIKNNICNNG